MRSRTIATRSAILVAARKAFVRDSYDNVGIRDIATAAGVDAALISRYFGSKEELFSEVLGAGKRGLEVIGTEVEGLAKRTAALLLERQGEDDRMDDLLILLHSAMSPAAAPLVSASISERFHKPLAELVGGENAELRARLFWAMLLGVSISQQINWDSDLAPDMHTKLETRVRELIERAVAPL